MTIRRRRWLVTAMLLSGAMIGTASGHGQDGSTATMPVISRQLTPPSGDARRPVARVVFAPYRFDDLLWENDRTAHRIYGPALEKEEPPSTSGIDAWGKSVAWPFMERQLATGDQHGYHGEGIDFYNVGIARGMGGLGIWDDNKLWVSRNFQRYRILKNGPDVAEFEVDYAAWPVGVGRSVRETRRFRLPMGTQFTRMVSAISSDKPDPLVIGIGISQRATSPTKASGFTADRAHGRFTAWGPTDPDKGTMGTAVMVDPAMIVGVTKDFDNYLVLIRVTPGKPFVYYAGSVWDKGGHIRSQAEWEGYVKAQAPDFRAEARP